jgi:hypothetical protein
MATAAAHAGDPLTIGARTCSREEAVARLAARLHDLPTPVVQTRQVPLGRYRGLSFALVLSPAHGPAVSVEGATPICIKLSPERM